MASSMTMNPTKPITVDYAKGKGGKTIKSNTHVKFADGGAVKLPGQDVLDRADANWQQAKLLKKAMGKK